MAYKKKYAKKAPVQRIPFKLGFPPSEAQLVILDAVRQERHMLIDAVAGSGKSSTLAYLMSEIPKPAGTYIAFNKDIVTEMEPKCPPGVEVKTRHAVGYGICAKNCTGRVYIDKYKVMNLLDKYGWPDDKKDPKSWERRSAMDSLIAQMKNNLVDIDDTFTILDTAGFYGIEIDCMQDFLPKLPDIFNDIIEQGRLGLLDFNDMKWLPVACEWKFPQSPTLYLDEYQDSSTLDMLFDSRLLAPGGQAIMVGDPYQSIYGFAGANSNSIAIAVESFGADKYPLNVTFRCAKSIVEESKYIVPHFTAWDRSPEGNVGQLSDDISDIDFDSVREDAMLLCRRNAPLVRPCFAALRQGKRANIKGRDIGEGLIRTIKGLKAKTLSEMLDRLEVTTEAKKEKILARSKPSTSALEALDDTKEIIEAFADQIQVKTLDDLYVYIGKMFVESAPGMMFSSVHKSKGLEAEQVVILQASQIRLRYEGITDEAQQQEANVEYVAKSRAKKEMLYVG